MKNALIELLKFKREHTELKGVEDEDLVQHFMDFHGYVDVPTWNKEDIESRALSDGVDLSLQQVDEVAELMASKHDANEGINWEVISVYIDIVNRG